MAILQLFLKVYLQSRNMLNEINSSIEINTIYAVPMTVDEGRRILMKENYKSRIYEINTIDAKCIVKRGLRKRAVKYRQLLCCFKKLFI